MSRKRTRARGFVTQDEALGRLDVLGLRMVERVASMAEANTGFTGLTDVVMESAETIVDSAVDKIGNKRLREIEAFVQSEPMRRPLMQLLGVKHHES